MKMTVMAAATIASIVATTALAQGSRQDFTLVNRTGYDISEVYVSPSKTNDWEEDILGDDGLEDGDSVTITFRRAGKTCIWDLKVVYSDDDSSAVWHDINLCQVEKVTIRYNRKTDTTSATFD